MKSFDECFIFCILYVIMENMIESKLLNDIIDYCRINGIEVNMYVNQKLRSALMIDKYGKSPFERNAEAKVDKVGVSEEGKTLTVGVSVKPEPKLEKIGVPFVVASQEEIDWNSKTGELEPLEPMKPDNNHTKEKPQKKQGKKTVNSEKSDEGKIIVNKRVLK